MNRAELERLDRDALISRAEDAGVTRARILTRPELVDELLLRTTVDPAAKQKARGFFGVARQTQCAQPRGLSPHGGRRIFIIEHRALAVLGLPQLSELAVGSGLICVVGQCNLHW